MQTSTLELRPPTRFYDLIVCSAAWPLFLLPTSNYFQWPLLLLWKNMKSPFGTHMVLPLAALLLSSLVMARSFRSTPMGLSHMTREKDSENPKEAGKEELSWGIYPTGSSLPDCSHACGPCFPCKRVMVSFQCSVAESCPIVYRCMCKGRFYHVPSN